MSSTKTTKIPANVLKVLVAIDQGKSWRGSSISVQFVFDHDLAVLVERKGWSLTDAGRAAIGGQPTQGAARRQPVEADMAKTPTPAVDTTFHPLDIGDGFGGHVRRCCARDGFGGPCWGQVEWVETRDPLVGRCQKALCQGHRGARYKAAPCPATPPIR